MRLVLLTLVGVSSTAFAGGHSGGGGGGHGGGSGPLGQVTAGVATATASSGSSSSTGGSVTSYYGGTGGDGISDCERYRAAVLRDPRYRAVELERECRTSYVERTGVMAGPASPAATATAFAGAQKVVGSDGSVSLAASVIDRWLRVNGSFTQYYETEMTGDRITMAVPELSVGVHLGADGPTRMWIETGVMYLKTSDPAGSSSIAGPTVGTRIEHQMSPDLALAGTVEGAYLADGVRGVSGRVGVRFHHVEAAFRILDLNVGPALYGPEVGVGF